MTGTPPRTPPQIIYTDLDGTLLGRGGSIFHTAAGDFTMVGADALRRCRTRGAQVCFCSGRSEKLLREDARILGINRYIAEAGCVLVRDNGSSVINNCEPFGHRDGITVFEEIGATGAPELLLDHFGKALAYHEPWYREHSYSHLLRGQIDIGGANELLVERGLGEFKLVDNGVIEDRGYNMPVENLHAYHIIPRRSGKGSAIELDLKLSGLAREDAIACGDSAQDLEMAGAVRSLYLMANAAENHSGLPEMLKAYDNVVLLKAAMVEGFSEAVRRELE